MKSYIGLSSRLTGAPKLPPGLAEIMEALSREVIIHNPSEEDMHQFCAAHLKKLIDLRDERSTESAPKKLSLEERIAIAQQKVRERAEKRWKKYDSEHKPVINIEPTQSVDINEQQEEHEEEATTSDNLYGALYVPNVVQNEELKKEHNMLSNFPIDTAALIAPVLSIQPESYDATDNKQEKETNESQVVTATENLICNVVDEVEIKNDDDQVAISVPDNDNETSLICVNDNEHKLDGESADSAYEIARSIVDQMINIISGSDTHTEVTQMLNDTEIQYVEDASSQILPQNLDGEPNEENMESNNSILHLNLSSSENENTSVLTTIMPPLSQPECSKLQPEENTREGDNESPNIIELPEKSDDIVSALGDHEPDSAIIEDNTDKITENEEKTNSNVQKTDGNKEFSSAKEEIDNVSDDSINGNADKSKENNNLIDNSDNTDNPLNDKEDHVLDIEDARSSEGTDNLAESNIENEVDNDDSTMESKLQNNEDETNYTITDADESTIKIDSSSASSPNLPQTDESEVESTQSKTKTMDLETAAVTIQKVFRSYMFKSRTSSLEDGAKQGSSIDESYINDVLVDIDAKNSESVENVYYENNKDRKPLGLTRMDTTLQTVNEEKSLSLSTDDSSTLSSAATTIQAHVRGFLVRNRLHSNKTTSSNSGVNSDEPSSLEGDNEQNKNNKTVLNIHIVPEGGSYLSRDESTTKSLDLPYDISPSASVNLHPLGYDKNERRKQLKREDAIQIISPPTINSGKLSEDVESLKEVSVIGADEPTTIPNPSSDSAIHSTEIKLNGHDAVIYKENTFETAIQMYDSDEKVGDKGDQSNGMETDTALNQNGSTPDSNLQELYENGKEIVKSESSSDNDVVMPANDKVGNRGGLLHSSEFHDVLIPTTILRSDMGVTRGE